MKEHNLIKDCVKLSFLVLFLGVHFIIYALSCWIKIIYFIRFSMKYDIFYSKKLKWPSCLSGSRTFFHYPFKRSFECHVVDFILTQNWNKGVLIQYLNAIWIHLIFVPLQAKLFQSVKRLFIILFIISSNFPVRNISGYHVLLNTWLVMTIRLSRMMLMTFLHHSRKISKDFQSYSQTIVSYQRLLKNAK